MNRKTWLLALLVGAGPMAAALAEEPVAALSREQVAAILSTDDAAILGPEALAAILTPRSPTTTRSLKPGEGRPKPGATGSGVIPDLKIQFATNSATISRDAERQLGALAIAMQFPQMQDIQLVIAGHTDARGNAQANQILSQKRAEAVVRWLVHARSVAPARLQAVGYGEERLADATAPASARNRRVEVIARQAYASASSAGY